ncbi:MAG TPA: diaminopimelate epimerase [Actinobacteria bacterium]|nr:diaminopimelate epimerase [Actinomycetota bacterium]
MPKILEFAKSQGAGNDFIIIDDLEGALNLTKRQVEHFCDRRFGIGADGLILIRPSKTPGAEFFMHFFNSDGSLAEMCGNGIRCFAKYLFEYCLTNSKEMSIETLAGIKKVQLIFDGAEVFGAKVDMGKFSLKSKEIPVEIKKDEVINHKVDVEGQSFNITCVSMGNPHCVIFVEDLSKAPVTTMGPRIENLSMFPNKTNVEFVQIINKSEIKLRVWERGAGETLACGTGACAAAVAANKLELIEDEILVHLPGGDLEIKILNGNIFMTGQAEEVFTGKIYLT